MIWSRGLKLKRETVRYGLYINKPILRCAVQYICGLTKETSRKEIEAGKIRLNYDLVVDPEHRLSVGRYRVHHENMIYTFYID